jgi:phenylalanyl-tRNA synthetase beta chain
MKIAYSHLVKHIKENPSIEMISDKLFQLGHEHETHDGIFDMEFTPNRGDCLSIKGLLRDLAVFYSVDLSQDIYSENLDQLLLNFENLSENICTHISFLKIEIENIPKEYTGSLNSYFSDLCLNKNNFYTDVSNYLSYETGQPTHCYDSEKVKGKIVLHEIDGDEEFETLLGKKIMLTGNNAVFSLDNNVISLAGVMGGKSTSCTSDTKTAIIECAYFQPEAVIGKSVKYDIHSDSSHKFERGVDPLCQENVLRRFIKIVSEHANIKDVSMISYKYKKNLVHRIPVDVNKISKIIGAHINKQDYLKYLLKLGFHVEEDFIEVPSFRSDIYTHNDLAEEVARVIGYDNILKSEINIPCNQTPFDNNIENKLRYFLLDHGFYEVINSPFVKHDLANSIKVDNPLDTNRQFLRTNIYNSLVDNLLYNEKRQKDSIKLFEISDIYSSSDGIHKKRILSIIASGKVGLNYRDFSKNIDKEYLARIFQEILPNYSLDFNELPRDLLNTKIKNKIISLEIAIDNLPIDLSYKEKSRPPHKYNQYNPISEKPSSYKDLSFSINDYSKATKLQDLLLNYENDIIKHVYVFDYFFNEKKEEIKIGFRFIFQSKKTTLTAGEIDVVYNEVVEKSLSIKGLSIPGLQSN